MKYAIRLICTAGADALRLFPIEGSAGRYMSMANGPTTVMRPRTRTGGRMRCAILVPILKLTTFGPAYYGAAEHGRRQSQAEYEGT